MKADHLRSQAQAAHAAGNRKEVCRLIAIAVARLHTPSRKPLASIAGHIRSLWLA